MTTPAHSDWNTRNIRMPKRMTMATSYADGSNSRDTVHIL